MIAPYIKDTEIKALKKVLESSDKIVVTCHVSPDGDAVGSSLAMAHLLTKLGKTVNVVTPDLIPKSLKYLSGAGDIVVYTRSEELVKQLFETAELIICLDFNSAKRIDRVAPYLESATCQKVLIDHHLHPENFADVIISYPEVSSTCMLLFGVICRLGLFDLVDKKIAECIYTGMMTDTGNFSYNSNDPDLYVVISELLKKGINKDRIYTLACNTSSLSKLKLNGYAISDKLKIYKEHKAALITLDDEELKRFEYEKGDTEGLVNVPLSLPEVTYSFFLREEKEFIKVSARSKGDFPVNIMCGHFNGGGHKNAAGGEFYGTMDDAVKLLESIMVDYDKYLK